MGLSPFKTERTPSFTVNDQKGFYHCFASGEHGDIFKFLMATEGLTFPEAVERLAAEAGVPCPRRCLPMKPRSPRRRACTMFAKRHAAFSNRRFQAEKAVAPGAYLDRRGMELSEIEAFRLGYAPDSKTEPESASEPKRFFAAKRCKMPGFVIHGEDIAVPYDRFRGRLIFPICDAKRRVIAFGGRALSEGQQPKYLNSPETPLFHKGHVLFNFAPAREASRAAKTIIVAEGYMDVIALTRAGFPAAVAPLGHRADRRSTPAALDDGAHANALF